MMELQHANVSPSETDTLAQLVQDQLAREEALLQANLEGLREVWAALQRNDPQTLQTVLERQVEQERHRNETQHERNHFRRQTARLLGMAPEDVHLGLVIRNVRWESAKDLEQRLHCLRQKTREAETLRDQVSSLTCHCLSFLNRFLLDLTGSVDGGCYSPSGVRPETASGVLFEMRG
ncbi:MAG TPA: hypothetical protein VKU02_25490 [Gemmataceae bacterium]|nr:hypothetical protein [Gemmataceae bacterium]